MTKTIYRFYYAGVDRPDYIAKQVLIHDKACELFGGFTEYSAIGGWRDTNAPRCPLVLEKARVLECIDFQTDTEPTPEPTADEIVRADNLAGIIRAALYQDCVIWTRETIDVYQVFRPEDPPTINLGNAEQIVLDALRKPSGCTDYNELPRAERAQIDNETDWWDEP